MDIRLFAKKGSYFKENSEVLNEHNERFKLKDWADAIKGNKMLLVRGIRICSGQPGEDRISCKQGQEYEDLCWCQINELNKTEA